MGKYPDVLFLKSEKAILGRKKPFLGHTVSLKIFKNLGIQEFQENWHLCYDVLALQVFIVCTKHNFLDWKDNGLLRLYTASSRCKFRYQNCSS